MRTIFITGVSKGLGLSLAQTLDAPGTRVIGFGRTRGEFTGDFHECDLGNPQHSSSSLDSTLASLDLESADSIIFISNAGTLGPLGKAQNLDPIETEKAVITNLCGSSIAATSFLKRTNDLDTKKLFIQISSGAALPDRAKGSCSLYCACKAGQEQLVRAIAIEQKSADHPAKLININPGVMETAMQEQIRQVSPSDFPEVAEFIKMSEDGKIPSSDTIAAKIRDLINDFDNLENGKTYTLANYKK